METASLLFQLLTGVPRVLIEIMRRQRYRRIALVRCCHHSTSPLHLRTDPIIDPSLCLLKKGVLSFRFGLESIGCSTHNKSAKRFAFDKLDDSPCLPVKGVRILLYFEPDDVPAILVRR
jgi:hypothetical protein